MLNCRHRADGADLDGSVRMCCPYENSCHLHHCRRNVQLEESIHFQYHYVRVVQMMELQQHHHINPHHRHNHPPIIQLKIKHINEICFSKQNEHWAHENKHEKACNVHENYMT